MRGDGASSVDMLEGRDVPAARIAWIGLGVGGVVLAAVAVVFALLHAWRLAPGGDAGGAAQVAVIPAPRLQTAPQPERAAHRDAERRTERGIAAAMAAVVASGAGR